MRHRNAGLLMAVAFGIGMSGASLAQENGEERNLDAVHCVRINDIRGIEIVNSETLIFRMRGGTWYRNELPHRCPGLRPNDTLMYRTSVGRLCSVDIVTVLNNWGVGFSPGASCGLGMFHPITEGLAEEQLQSEEEVEPENE